MDIRYLKKRNRFFPFYPIWRRPAETFTMVTSSMTFAAKALYCIVVHVKIASCICIHYANVIRLQLIERNTLGIHTDSVNFLNSMIFIDITNFLRSRAWVYVKISNCDGVIDGFCFLLSYYICHHRCK